MTARTVSIKYVSKAIKSLKPESAAGSNNFRPNHLKHFVAKLVGETENRPLQTLTVQVSLVLLENSLEKKKKLRG